MAEEAPSYALLTEEALKLMKQRLPEYVVNCFVSAGFDTLDVIADMDTSSDPGNSLQAIEDFINAEHASDDPKFSRGTMATSTFKFPPGHRHAITKFMKEVKQLKEEKKRTCQRSTYDATCPKSKRRKVMETASCETSGGNDGKCSSEVSREGAPITQANMFGDIRRQVAKWQQSQKDVKLRTLKEHEQYEVQVEAKGGNGHVAPSIQCKLCHKSYSLGLKEGRPMISNWTKHVAKCVLAQQKKARAGRRIHQYFPAPVPQSSPPSNSATPASTPLSPDLTSPEGSVEEHRYTAAEMGDLRTESLQEPEMLLHTPHPSTVDQDPHFRLSPPY